MRINTKIIWLTGLSGSGKSTIAHGFLQLLKQRGKSVRILDGDDIREKRHTHLDFSEKNIKENNRLITELCQELLGAYDYLIVSVITPYEESRQRTRSILGEAYFEVYLRVSLDTVISRDTKGLYQKALNGEIKNFIGVCKQTPYEIPQKPDLILDTENHTVEECVDQLIRFVGDYVNS